MKILSKGLSLLSKSLLTLLLFTSSPLVFAQNSSDQENLIVNGSFENYGHLNRGSWGTFKSIEGWTANRGLLEVQINNTSGIAPVDGNAKIELDSLYNSRIFQQLNDLEEGETYRLSLSYSPRINHRNSNKIRVKWNNQKLAILNGREQGWTEYSYDVVARAKNKLKLHAIGRNDSFGGLIDDVSLVCITCEGETNSSPIANTQNATVIENSTDNTITLSASDADGDTLSYSLTDPENGTLSGQAPDLTYTPNTDFSGTDSFTFTVSDGVDSDTATVDITVTALPDPNSAPIASPQEITFTENSSDNAIALIATDADGDALSYSVTDPSNGTLSGQAPNLRYTPNANFFGTDSFSFTVSDGIDSDTADISIFVTKIPSNSAPIAIPLDLTVLENSSNNSLLLLASDADFDALIFSATDPSNGTLSGNAPFLEYTPNPDFFGTDSFSFTVSDGIESDTGTVSIIVEEVPDPTSTVNTRITTPSGSVVDSTTIVATLIPNGTSTTFISGADGNESLELIAGAEYVLKFDKAGFATQVTRVRAPVENGVVNLDITMIERGRVQMFTSEDGATLADENGAEVTIQPNSFVDANGDLVTGEIEVTITPVDVSNPNSLAAFPGEFTGTTAAGDTPIISFGTVEYKFTQNGNPLQLAPNVTADIQIPIYIPTRQNGDDIVVGDIIPLWSLNEETGIWLQEGTGEVVESTVSPTGLAFKATVSHFTWWNCDVSMNAAQAIVTVTGSQAGTALIKATTNANIGFRSPNVDTVTEIGVPTSPLFIPSEAQVCFIADINYNDGTSATTAEICEFAAPNSTVNITLNSSVPGPLNIVGNGSEGPLTVNSFVNFDFEKIRLNPTTSETSVQYSILSGGLPPGVSLNTINSTTAEIVGSPSTAESYSVVIQGTDNDSTTDTIAINFVTSSDVPPPDLSFMNLVTDAFSFNGTFDLNDNNSGGLATNWELRWNFNFEQIPPPPEITLDPNTGILTLSSCTNQNGFNVSWNGFAYAENASGSSEEQIRVFCSPGLAE